MLFDPAYDPNHVWMAREKGQVLGLLVVSLQGETARLKLLAVDPQRQRQGLGRQILERAEERLEGEGARRFVIEPSPPWQYFPGVLEQQQGALAFFAALGYRQGELGHMSWLKPSAQPQAAAALNAADWVAWAKASVPFDAEALEDALSFQEPRAVGVTKGSQRALCAFDPGRSVGPCAGDPALALLAAKGAWAAASLPGTPLLVLDRRNAAWWDAIAPPERRQLAQTFSKSAGLSPA